MDYDLTKIDEFRMYCLDKTAVTEELPFGPDTLVFKVAGKVFALCDIAEFESVNLKCDPEYALELRERYPASVKPGYHMNKKHWNTIYLDGSISAAEVERMIDNSYDLVIDNLPTDERLRLLGK